MEPLMEEEEYNWREVILPSLIPVVAAPELDRETGERRRGRDVIVAVDHGPNSKHAFDWALTHLCRLADTVHLVHAVSSFKNEIVYEMTQGLMEKLAVEAFEIAMVKTKARIVEGDAGKAICREAERLRPAAVVVGTRGRGFIQSVIQGSVSEYCFRNCKTAPVIIVPGKDAGEGSVL
ncbi:Adenine nucleotide alpha hydrolases-like superfamily protein [Striga hermonthica]|uniref:Adenine nucleotide alpha hydrolases-like superfamily protein n=1 Tax=Striga hermonthica TaxID=68872 RepID=A0A9N7NBV7_STRHE|nr:Adenine nucleotide alpha hydrolases-like superfamily protein [Striga hermonthica]